MRTGDWLRSSNNRLIGVDRVSDSNEVATVYNFHVVDYHTYFVGGDKWDFDVWTHNSTGHTTGTTIPSGGTMVSTPGGMVVRIPKGWTPRVANNGKGIVYQRPGATGNADSIRIMEPTAMYPNGYVRYYNSSGQPLNVNGLPGDAASTHIPLDFVGAIPGWPS